MKPEVSEAVLRCSRNQKSGVGAKAVYTFSFATLLSVCFWQFPTKAEPQSSLPVQSNSKLKHRVKLQAWFERRAEGWHWYEDPLNGNEAKKEELQKGGKKEKRYDQGHGARPSPPLKSPTEIIEAQRKALEQKLHLAIIEPSRENITSYLLAQQALMNQSQRFSEAWKKVVLSTPFLDETLIHPVDQNARHIYYAEKHKELSQHIKALAKDYGLFFFFRANCPYCHHFAPIVKRFSQKYGWSVLGISLDGGALPEFSNAKRDNGISKRLQITHVPALIVLHPKTGKLIPLAYGMVSEAEIEARVLLWSSILNSESMTNPSKNRAMNPAGFQIEGIKK